MSRSNNERNSKATKASKEPDWAGMHACLIKWKTENEGIITNLYSVALRLKSKINEGKSPLCAFVDGSDFNELTESFDDCLLALTNLRILPPSDDSLVHDPIRCIEEMGG